MNDSIRTLHRSADLELADEGGIAPLEDEINIAQRHRFGGEPAERKYPLWPVVLVLALFWTAIIFGMRSCSRADTSRSASQGAAISAPDGAQGAE